MAKYLYSIDDETYRCNDFNDAVSEALDSNEFPVKIRRGVVVYPMTSSFFDFDSMVERMNEWACDEYGDLAEDFMDDPKGEFSSELKHDIRLIIDSLAHKHGAKPNFGDVTNIEEAVIKFDGDQPVWSTIK